jgi:hypothetical protein
MRQPCIVWRGALNSDGYAVVRIHGRLELAHRMAYRLHVGPIPRGREVHHECHNRACINPAHLRAVSHRENCRARRVA